MVTAPASEPAAESGPEKKKPIGKILVIGATLAVLTGASAFFVASRNVNFDIPSFGNAIQNDGIEFVLLPLNPMAINIPDQQGGILLRFTSHLEVRSEHADRVNSELPRVHDVMNVYFRTLTRSELADPAIIVLIRQHLLRRIRFILGDESVRDILISEFVFRQE
ncbi:MAG: flagellar basal body-associated FliL family protein [Roseinatronobacter sp.]